MNSSSIDSIGFILSTYLSTDTSAAQSASLVCSIVSQFQLLRRKNEVSDETASSVLNRWSLRLNSLLGSKNASLNLLGAQLALMNLNQDPNVLLADGPRWLSASQFIIARDPPSEFHSLSAAIDLVLCIFEYGSKWPEFARENCDSKTIFSIGKALIAISGGQLDDRNIRCLGLRTLATLVVRYPSLLRPMASELEAVALTNLLHDDTIISTSCTSLFINLYRLSGKVEASSSWAKTIKATIGTIDIVLDALLSPMLKEARLDFDSGFPPSKLSPLEIPPQDLISPRDVDPSSEANQLASQGVLLLVRRVDRLVRVIVAMLSQPTERAVSLPLGELSVLGYRLLLLGKSEPHEQPDLKWKSAWDCMGGTFLVRAVGCRLIAKLAECTATRFSPFATPTLSIIASAIEAAQDGETGSTPDTSVLCYTYARIVSGCLPSPATLSSTLEHVLKAVLNDVACIYARSDSFMSLSSTLNSTSKKAKKKAKKFNCDETWNAPMVADPMNFSIAERALSTLELLLAAVPHFFPSPYLSLSVRLLLSLASHPSFAHPASNGSDSSTILVVTSMPPTNSPNLAFATHPILRLRILRCLVKCLPVQRTSAQRLMGLNLAQNLTGILHNILTCKDDSTGELAHLARSGLNIINLMIRPRVPPIYLTEAQVNCEEDVEIPQDESEDETGDAISEGIAVETPRKAPELVACASSMCRSPDQCIDNNQELPAKSTAALTANSASHSNVLLKKSVNTTFPFATSATVTQKQDTPVLSYQALGTKYPEIRKRKSDDSEVQDLAPPPIKKRIDQCKVDSDDESDDEPIPQLIFDESDVQSDA
ncbi:hypothetical protein O181_044163 [Austropuccinia psidii MF-1]|uniref:Pre-rRNA-processing protein RIX1 n=1 Tax=Austropuccinia psidii MF-1 TaxID=1389203 RepID=A0A9Q3DPK0_9BASI|nr:hypothetical protein [Austropuccinia psidii MF-1]